MDQRVTSLMVSMALVAVMLFFESGEAFADSCYAKWSCSSSACAKVMGATSGNTGPFSAASECDAWRKKYFYGATCSCTTGASAGNSAAQSNDPGTVGARIAGEMFSRLNPQTPSQIGLAASASIATGILSVGIAEMFKGPSPEQIRQRQIQEEQARLEHERIARESAAAAERKHNSLLAELKADSGTPQLTLKIDSNPIQLQDDLRFVGIPGNDELKLKLGDPEHLARGSRVVDCVQTRQVYERMSAGLPLQREQLAKYEQQIHNSTQLRPAISEEARSLAIKAAYDEARRIATSAAVVRARLGAMKLDGVSAEKRTEWVRTLHDWDKLHEQIENIEKANTAATAGRQFGEDLPALGKTLQERALRLNQLVVDSGLAETAGEELAKYGFGPAGSMAFRVAKFGIDSAYVTGKQFLNESEIAQARATYDHLRSQYSQTEEKVNNARDDLAQLCNAKS